MLNECFRVEKLFTFASSNNLKKEIMTTANVNKSEYEVHAYFGGYYGICKVGSHGANPIFGGDSADEDAYNKELIDAVFDMWNGELEDCGNSKYGENGLILKY